MVGGAPAALHKDPEQELALFAGLEGGRDDAVAAFSQPEPLADLAQVDEGVGPVDGTVPLDEDFIEAPRGQVAFVDLEANGMLFLTLALSLRQRDDDGAVGFVVIAVRVAQRDEELRVGGVPAHAFVATATGRPTPSPIAPEVEHLKLFARVSVHRVRVQMAKLQLSKVPEKVPKVHVKLSVVIEGESQVVAKALGDGLPVAVVVAPVALPLAAVSVRVAHANQGDGAAAAQVARRADVDHLGDGVGVARLKAQTLRL